MANFSGRTGGRPRRVRPGFVSRAAARFHGRRDAADLVSLLREARGGRVPSDVALPPHALGIRSEVERGNARLRRRMLVDGHVLVTAIQSESVRIVTQYTVRGRPAPAALARYGQMVADWRNRAAVQRAKAQELADQANQLLACYWDAAWQRARRDMDPDDSPLDEHRPAGWLPGAVTLDASWHRCDDWLDTDSWYGTRSAADRPAVQQALALLDSQSTTGPTTSRT
ncbi:hypothetical protein [Streptomyces abyssomicinicus]|uniref:hypothetical protein n=1 Tax=Streptomyces abyssomicinicus TaxID=574929 RepID=UPI00124F9903|nr:hypothetical protein [Streptomyces abyssomicinicus]